MLLSFTRHKTIGRISYTSGSHLQKVCAGVIVESEDLHRDAYNAAFAHHEITCGDKGIANWSEAFYDELSNKVGGGKGKMRWYFGKSANTCRFSYDNWDELARQTQTPLGANACF